MTRYTIFLSLLLLMPVSATAQGWQLHRFDDGSFFEYSISPAGTPDFTLLCGERSPTGLSAMQTGNMEPETTQPDILELKLGNVAIGSPTDGSWQRSDVVVAAGGQGYRLPELRWNELQGGWRVDLLALDVVFAAIAAAPSFDLHSGAGQRSYNAKGFAEAHAALIQHCRQTFAAIGQPWQGDAVVAPAGGARQAADGHVRRSCNGAYHAEDGAFLTGEIDGDGVEDVAVNMGKVACLTGNPRPFCGASQCPALVFASSAPYRWHDPINLMSQGVRLQPLSNGNMAVTVGGSLSECHYAFGNSGCEFMYYWNGADLVRLN
jgi:hypothetical protein